MNTIIYMDTPQLHICVLPQDESRGTMWFYVNRSIEAVATHSVLICNKTDGIELITSVVLTDEYAKRQPNGAALELGGTVMEVRLTPGYDVTGAIYGLAAVTAQAFEMPQEQTYVGYYGQNLPRQLSEMLGADIKEMSTAASVGAGASFARCIDDFSELDEVVVDASLAAVS